MLAEEGRHRFGERLLAERARPDAPTMRARIQGAAAQRARSPIPQRVGDLRL